MPGSQLKQLKAKLQARRTAQAHKPGAAEAPQKSKPSKPFKRDPKAHADSLRRTTLLPALQNRHRVGGIVDRRIGENDPTMSPEERMLQRYTSQRNKRNNAFNLDEDAGEGDMLTHSGRGLFDGPMNGVGEDDFEREVNDEDVPSGKRKRIDLEESEPTNLENDIQPQKKKTKKEIMEEVIAKSKLHKYERQQAKDEDEDVRDELDKGLPAIVALLQGRPAPAPPPANAAQPAATVAMHPDRMAQMSGNVDAGSQINSNNYDKNIRQLAMDKKAQPADRTKTDEEKAEEEAERLRGLEERRLQRMAGIVGDRSDDEDDDAAADSGLEAADLEDDIEVNEAAAFGFKDISTSVPTKSLHDDEDDFVLDEDLIASASDIDGEFSDEETGDDDARRQEAGHEDDDEDFLREVLTEKTGANAQDVGSGVARLAYTFPCPESHEQLLAIIKDVAVDDLPTVVQRIRALHNPQLNPQNKGKLANFAISLVDHLSYLGDRSAPLQVLETLVRHVHSLSKSYPDATSNAFRSHLKRMHSNGDFTAGDLVLLTAIASIYPTSDHFHQVVTPAITLMARWLGIHTPHTELETLRGGYLVALCVSYQTLSKRYVPEAISFTTAAINSFPDSETIALHVHNLMSLVDLYATQAAFFEIFHPTAWSALKKTGDTRSIQRLRIALRQANLRRRPLELHHHKPLPVKAALPKFEEGFNPSKHYDPDRDRAESARLRKEHRREHKGALRELRKDAAFLHRESLRDKKQRDAEYEKKQRRLIAEIQGEEGREANAYEREKRKRKGRR